MHGRIQIFDDNAVLIYQQDFNPLDCAAATFYPIKSGQSLFEGFKYEPMLSDVREWPTLPQTMGPERETAQRELNGRVNSMLEKIK